MNIIYLKFQGLAYDFNIGENDGLPQASIRNENEKKPIKSQENKYQIKPFAFEKKVILNLSSITFYITHIIEF